MSVGAAALALVLCGIAGLLVPALIARIPEPAGADEPRYAPVSVLPGLRWRAALASAVCGALLGGSIGLDWPLLFLLPLVPMGVALAVVDLHTHLLPTKVIWPALGGTAVLAALAAAIDGDGGAFLSAAVMGALVFGFFHALWWCYPAGMGYGDVRLSALIGFVLGYFGWVELVIGLYSAFATFAVLGVARAVVRRDRSALRTPLPFGPFLLGGALAGIVLADALWGHLVTG